MDRITTPTMPTISHNDDINRQNDNETHTHTTKTKQAIGSRSLIKALEMKRDSLREQYRNMIREKKIEYERFVCSKTKKMRLKHFHFHSMILI